jgi:hypothetical protein
MHEVEKKTLLLWPKRGRSASIVFCLARFIFEAKLYDTYIVEQADPFSWYRFIFVLFDLIVLFGAQIGV